MAEVHWDLQMLTAQLRTSGIKDRVCRRLPHDVGIFVDRGKPDLHPVPPQLLNSSLFGCPVERWPRRVRIGEDQRIGGRRHTGDDFGGHPRAEVVAADRMRDPRVDEDKDAIERQFRKLLSHFGLDLVRFEKFAEHFGIARQRVKRRPYRLFIESYCQKGQLADHDCHRVTEAVLAEVTHHQLSEPFHAGVIFTPANTAVPHFRLR